MSNYRCIAILAASILVWARATPSPAQGTASQEGVIRINVNLVQVDAVVTDSGGRPVTNLIADDFQILQDGKPQAITNFAFVNLKDSSVSPAPPRRPAESRSNTAAPSAPSIPLRPDQIRRTIAIVVDDLGLSFGSIVRIREALKKWVDRRDAAG